METREGERGKGKSFLENTQNTPIMLDIYRTLVHACDICKHPQIVHFWIPKSKQYDLN